MKRSVSLFLVLVLIVMLLPAGAFAADTTMKASSKIMDYIKSKEGCQLKAYKLEGEQYYTIGYGHYGPDVKKDQTITQSQADKLFSQDLKTYEAAVNKYNTDYSLKLTQNQFDALVSFTYNVGTYWNNYDWRIAKYMRNGFRLDNGEPIPELELADAFGVISNGGAGLLPGLITRRMQEAKIFLYGDYDGTGSIDFVYVTLNPNGGTITGGNRVAIYYKNQPYGVLPQATRQGYYLEGWKSSSGFVTPTTIAAKNLELTASWTQGDGKTEYKLTVQNGAGSGSYKYGEKVYINQVMTPGYCFVGWESDGVAIIYDVKSGGYYITMPSRDVTVKALYQEGCIFGEYCPTVRFVDVDPLHWAHEGIDFCVSNGIMTGTGVNTFCPDDPMTKAMIVTALYRNAGSPKTQIDCPYSDIQDFSYYYDAVLWAYGNGICGCNEFGMFCPDEIVSREEFASILYRYAAYLNAVTDSSSFADLGVYKDAGSISLEYINAMRWCISHNIIIGTDVGTLEPGSGATRGQVATMLLRFMQVCVSV